MSRLALLGGKPEVHGPLPGFRSIGSEERARVNAVIDSGLLSGFYGSPGEAFLGGPHVREFEARWVEAFACKHAVSVNSNTTGMVAAMGAIGLSPGDEVIVPAYTMSATAMAPLAYGGIPVFADVREDDYCLDPEKVAGEITPKTRAILVTNLFGQPARLTELRQLADAHGIYLIEDNAQGPFAQEQGRHAGTIGHIGVFSLNVHKHIQTGEGGVCCTDNDALAQRLQMIRNHGENVVESSTMEDLSNLYGFNFRLTELSAAVGLAQLEKASAIIDGRIQLAERLSQGLAGIEGITVPHVRPGARSVYYAWAARIDSDRLAISRSMFLKALAAEGFPAYGGYVAPLYRLPLFQRRMAMGRHGFPFTLTNRTYSNGLCPVTERLHERELWLYEICAYDPSDDQIDQMIAAVHKVVEFRHEIAALGGAMVAG
jgi:dTDP-4-amino-4,6-dideoxygalactose transaminase